MNAQILTDPRIPPARLEHASSRKRPRSLSASQDTTRRTTAAGFTLVELMIAMLVIGILAAIGIPNYLQMQKRATEGAVKSNMHTLQMSLEDFSLLNDGIYPVNASAVCIDGRNLAQVCPTGGFPLNPYTKLTSVVQWNADPGPGNKGEMAINPALATQYLVKANGSDGAVLPLTLTSGH